MTPTEQRLMHYIAEAQDLIRGMQEVIGTFLTDPTPDTPESYSRLWDRAEMLAEWDPTDQSPLAEYVLDFTTCEDCDRMVIPIYAGTAADDQCPWCS